MIDSLTRDIRHALRNFRRSPGFHLTAVAVLALGIGAATSIFSVVDVLMLRPLPHEDAARIVTLWEADERSGERREVAPANFFDWREQSGSFTAMAGVDPWSLDLTGGGRPEVVFAARVTEGFFTALGANPLIGRTFLAEEFRPNAGRVVILSYTFWQRRFGGDREIVGRSIELDGEPFTVVGVLPATFQPRLVPSVTEEREAWIPLVPEGWEEHVRDSGWWNVVARLEPGVELEEARAEMETIARRLATEHPETNRDRTVEVVPLREHLLGDADTLLLVLQGAVGLLLLIACANVANMLLARGAGRGRDLAIRSALGADRRRLVRQLFTESAVLAAAGAFAGIFLAHWGVDLFRTMSPGRLPHLDRVAIDGRVLLFAVGVTTLTGVLFGLFPSLRLSRPDLRSQIEGGAASTSTPARSRLRGGLVVAEIAFSLVLVVGTGLLVRSLVSVLQEDPGFRTEGVAAVQVFAWDGLDSDGRRTFVREATQRMEELPGARSSGAVSALPLIEANIEIETRFRIAGRPEPRPEELPRGHVAAATPGYFRTMGIPLISGRFLDQRDREDSRPVVVVTRTLARRYWPEGDAVGERIVPWEEDGGSLGRGPDEAPTEWEIVGVVGEVKHEDLESAPRAEIFFPHAQVPFGSMTFVVRSAGDPSSLIPPARQVVWTLQPRQAIYRTATLEELLDRSLAARRFNLIMLGGLGVFSLLLATVGLYGVVSHATRTRVREIGIRIALGADRAAVLRDVMGGSARLVGAGVVLGLLLSVALSRLISGLLYEVHPLDPVTFVAVGLVMALVATVATLVPARRAASVDPVIALRTD